MKTQLSKISITVLAGALLIYSAARSWDLIAATLPANQRLLAWFGLAALDVGLVLWLLQFLHGASGEYQRAIALVMVVVDFAGAVLLFSADTLYRTGAAGLTAALSPGQLRGVVLILSGVIALNVGATVLYHVFDPESRKRIAAGVAQDKIESEALRLIHHQAESLAGELAPMLADSWRNSTKARYMLTLKKAQRSGAAPTLDLQELGAGNGKVVYNQDLGAAELADPKNGRKGGNQ